MWLRTGKEHENEIMNSADWHLIDSLISESTLINNKVGSAEREAQALTRLEENCESQEVIDRIHQLARTI